jgi:hypothetical protein
VSAITRLREQYRGTVHLFIGTGCSLCKTTFIPFTIDYNNDTKHHGSLSHLIFKLVHLFVLNLSPCQSFIGDSFGAASERIRRRCSLSLGSSATKYIPNNFYTFDYLQKDIEKIFQKYLQKQNMWYKSGPKC